MNFYICISARVGKSFAKMFIVWSSILKILVEKMISLFIFGTNHAFKWQNTLFLTKKLFIKVYMMRCSRLVLFLQGKFHVGKSLTKCLLSEDPCWKNDISGFIWHKSFIQTMKCSSFSQRIVYGALLSLNCVFFNEKFVFYTHASASRLFEAVRRPCGKNDIST